MAKGARLSRILGSFDVACIAGALLAGALGCSGGGGGALPTSALLRVDDPDLRGASGDGRLSLSEALELASGARSLADLDEGERARVEGEPGAQSSDRISFAAGLRIAVRRQPGAVTAILPVLTGDGDEIDGSGATIDGSALGDEPQAS